MTTFPIVWDEQQSTDQLVFADLTDEEKKLAEMSEEIEMCHGIENVNCSTETPVESALETIEEKPLAESENSTAETKNSSME